MSIQTIHLHGFLGKKYSKTVKLAGENMYQIMSGLISRFGPEFKEDLRTHNWHIVEGSVKAGKDLCDEDLPHCKFQKKSLHFLPAVEGASSALRIVLGIVLVIVGTLGSAYGLGFLIPMGYAMVLGGVVEMLTKPKTQSPTQQQDQRGSSVYNGALNVTTQGGPVPLIYGRVSRASSVVISTDFSTDEA